MAPKTKIVDFDKMFTISLTCMMISGCHPYIPHDKKWLLRFILAHGFYTFVYSILAYNIYVNISIQEYSEACRHASPAVLYFLITCEYFVIFKNQKTVNSMIDRMKVDYTKDMPEVEKDIVLQYAKNGRKVCVTWMSVIVGTVLTFQVKHVFLELYTYVTDDWQWLELYPMIYPSPVEEYKHHPVVCFILYVLVLYFLVYSAIIAVGFVPIGPTFILHCCGQLEIVKLRTLALYTDNSTEDVEDKLKDIVKHLQNIYNFVECINDVFKSIYEVTLKGTPIILSVTLYEILEALKRGDLSIDYMTYILTLAYISGAPCYYSDKLMEQGDNVRSAIYTCGWETKYDHGVRKTLLVMLTRTLKPMAIRTVFLTLCLETLTDVYQQAYTLFNLMNAAWG